MDRQRRTWRSDIGIRMAGAVVSAIAYASLSHVVHVHAADPSHWSPGALVYGLLGIAFLGGSSGSAMLMLGGHLLEEVPVSERWRSIDDMATDPPRQAERVHMDAPARIRSDADFRLGHRETKPAGTALQGVSYRRPDRQGWTAQERLRA